MLEECWKISTRIFQTKKAENEAKSQKKAESGLKGLHCNWLIKGRVTLRVLVCWVRRVLTHVSSQGMVWERAFAIFGGAHGFLRHRARVSSQKANFSVKVLSSNNTLFGIMWAREEGGVWVKALCFGEFFCFYGELLVVLFRSGLLGLRLRMEIFASYSTRH